MRKFRCPLGHLGAVALCAALISCSQEPTRPDLARLYRIGSASVDAARGLDRLIETIRRDYNDPSLRVDIIANSRGGLVAR